MSNNHKYWTQARPLHGTAHDEQTPLTCNSSNNPADSIKTTTSIISDDRHSCCPCLWNRACIVVLSAIIAAALIFVSLAMLIDDQHKLSSSSAMNALKIVSIDGDVLQWCTLLASFALSVSSFYIATTNSKRIRNNTDIVTKLQQQQFSHLHYYSSEDAKLKATQQQTMLSLAILVSNYADLFVMANQQLRRYNNSSNNKQHLFIFPALTVSCTQMLDKINKAFATVDRSYPRNYKLTHARWETTIHIIHCSFIRCYYRNYHYYFQWKWLQSLSSSQRKVIVIIIIIR